MGLIGNLGSIITFETSDRRILTFKSFKKEVSANYTEHNRFSQKPQSEFTGAGLATVSFDITLNASFGVKPRAVMEAIEQAVETGRAETLVIGGRQIGTGKWVITSMSESWDYMYAGGELVAAKMSLTLKEYF